MEKREYDSFAKNCIMGRKPPCSSNCPLNLDIPAIVGNLQTGDFSAAYRAYRNQSVFPAIVCEICGQPCRQSCVRKEKDGAISLLLLEKACVEFTASDIPPNFNLPKRAKKIAIIGGGLAGLACALKLGTKSYDVTLYEKSSEVGGRLLGLLDPGIYLPEIKRQMQFARCKIELNREIISLDEIEFDAAFIATGRGGEHFGLINGIDKKSFSTLREGVFIGGAVLGAAPVEDIAQGVVASHSIEKFTKIGKADGIPETFIAKESCIVKDLDRIEACTAVNPENGRNYRADETILEAKRCLLCDCSECREACEIFDFFRKTPKQMAGEALTSLHSKAGITKQMATRLIASCNLCGLCGKICPEEIDMGQMAYDFRYFTAQSKTYPPGFSDFFIRDMLFSNHEAALTQSAPEYEKDQYLFFPGCQLGASKPEYVTKSYQYLLERFPDTAVVLGCCGAPADWGANGELNRKTIDEIKEKWEFYGKPTIVFACPTCQRQLKKFLPDAKRVSLYEVFVENGLPERYAALQNKTMSVFDPCASRDNTKMQRAVRQIAVASGARLEEMYYAGERARCCGWGGHISTANPVLAERIVHNRVNASGNPYITYCTNCRDTFAWKGKECVHILDFIFELDGMGYIPPSLGTRRKNKLLAKNLILQQVFEENPQEIREDENCMNIEISGGMLEKLHDALILEEEVTQTIEYCESTGNKFFDSVRNCFIGHRQLGIITYWVEYEKQGDRFTLLNAYSHRMEILEEKQ